MRGGRGPRSIRKDNPVEHGDRLGVWDEGEKGSNE